MLLYKCPSKGRVITSKHFTCDWGQFGQRGEKANTNTKTPLPFENFHIY